MSHADPAIIAFLTVENERLRGLLNEASCWLGDPSSYFGTDAGRDFDKRLQDEFASWLATTSASSDPEKT